MNGGHKLSGVVHVWWPSFMLGMLGDMGRRKTSYCTGTWRDWSDQRGRTTLRLLGAQVLCRAYLISLHKFTRPVFR